MSDPTDLPEATEPPAAPGAGAQPLAGSDDAAPDPGARESWRTIGVRAAFAQQSPPPPADWRWYESLGVLVIGVFLSGLVASAVLELVPAASGGEALGGIAGDLVLLVILVWWLQVFHPGWAPRMGQPSQPALDVAAGVVAGIVTYVVIAGLFASYVLSPLLDLIVGESVTAPEQVSTDVSMFGIVMTAVFALVFAPVVEEFFFRGVLFRSFRTNLGFWPAATISGVLFGAIHYQGGSIVPSLLLIIPLSLVGMAFAWIMERRGTVLAPICAHVAFNIIGFIGIVIAG